MAQAQVAVARRPAGERRAVAHDASGMATRVDWGQTLICARIPWVPLDNIPLGCNGHTLLFARLAAIEDIKRLRRQPL